MIDVQSYFEEKTIPVNECPDHQYKIQIITRNPLIIYIDKFLTQNEIKHLIELAEPLFKQSGVYDNHGKLIQNNYRTSWTADLERQETPIVKCIEQRFAQLQGNIDVEYLEPLQIVKYTSEQEFKPHFDWFSQADVLKNNGQRITTFFTYLYSNCSYGETEFVHIRFDKVLHKKFCQILICDDKSSQMGLRFRPLPGNSIFWFNVNEQGKGDYLTYHAGRPPKKDGLKIGLNTWTHDSKVFVKKRE
ncbi:hypothetical protein I4U23_015575 [Adineta vaga]|nr:hypothetical protein I4U23_015575 [Adineta vaga]